MVLLLAEYSDENIRKVILLQKKMQISWIRESRKQTYASYCRDWKKELLKDVRDIEQKQLINFAKEIDEYISKTYSDLASRTIAIRCDSMENCLP